MLSLNVNKTYYLSFHRAIIKFDNDNSIRMNDSIINSASHLKYLGVIIDSKLNWIPHITYVKNKISKGIGIMFKARDYSNKNCLSNLYHTYIFPYLNYCIEVWGNASHCHLLLFLTQNKIIRLITFLKHLAHTESIFKSLNILPLNSLYYHIIRLLMYKLANGLLAEALHELYIKKNKIHHYPTRNCEKYHIQTSTDIFFQI